MNVKYMEASSPLMNEFFGELVRRNKSPNTIDGYFIDLRSFFRFYKKKLGLVSKEIDNKNITVDDVDVEMCKKVTMSDVLEFLSYASSVYKNGAAAGSRKCSALRAFFKYLHSTGKIQINPVAELTNPKKHATLPHFLSAEQSINLLHAVEGENVERDYCIITLFLNCGMRLSELVGINYGDLLSDNRLRLRGKGGKERIIYLNQACVSAIDAYRRVRPVDGVIDKEALFLSKRKQRISPKTVQWLVKKYLGDIGLGENGYSVHKLRHTAATLMYDQGGVDIRTLQDILGHADLGTTQIYTHVSSERMKSAADANPLARLDAKHIEKKNDEADG